METRNTKTYQELRQPKNGKQLLYVTVRRKETIWQLTFNDNKNSKYFFTSYHTYTFFQELRPIDRHLNTAYDPYETQQDGYYNEQNR